MLLGGGSPAQAGAAQLLVLVGLLAAQTLVVVVQSLLIERGRLVPDDLRRIARRSGPPQRASAETDAAAGARRPWTPAARRGQRRARDPARTHLHEDTPVTTTASTAPDRSGTDLAAKVPAITVLFWVIKTLTTGMGEALSDFLANTDLVVAIAFGVLGLAGALWLQLRTRRYTAPVYWLAVAMVAVFGTMAADGVHLVGLPYAVTTVFYLLVVGVLFLWWRRSEGTLSIHSITTRRRELFYWATVLASFALGTAAGDLTADQLGWVTCRRSRYSAWRSPSRPSPGASSGSTRWWRSGSRTS